MENALSAHARFGEFELDLKSGRLRGPNQTVYLAEKPLRVLLALVEYGGNVVSREEIQKKLWPNDTAVDFEHGINTAIKSLRRSLGDSADNPSYIETVPRRGYRLMVPVELVSDSGTPAEPEAASDSAADSGVKTARGTLIGRTVSHYRVLDVIGGGGMGVVFRAEDLKLGRAVALKFLPEDLGSDLMALERFSREARSASSLDHTNICGIHEFGEHEGHPFIVMPLLAGQTLRDRLNASKGALPLNELVEIAVQVSEGLEAAHERGIIHRDIKPANIFLTAKGTCKILDFGLAKLLEGEEPEESSGARDSASSAESQPAVHLTLTRTGTAMGTAAYMSPEQVRGEKLDARTDLYSLGLVLYEMATGVRAFSGETAALVQEAILHKRAIPVGQLNPRLPAELVAIINKLLEKDREKRYGSAAELLADLEPLRVVPKRAGGRRWIRKKLLLAAGIAVAILAAGLLYWRFHRRAPAFAERGTVVIADFVNTTGDAVFDGSLRQALTLQMAQSPYLNVLSDSKVKAALQQMEKPADQQLTGRVADEVCLRAHSDAVLAGSIARAENSYKLVLKAVNCETGNPFDVVEAEASSVKQVLPALAIAGNEMRRRLGESLASVQKFDQPLLEATTTSLEALKEYSSGNAYGSPTDSFAPMKRVLELDPNFALAYAKLGAAYWNVGEGTLGAEYITKAFNLRDKVSLKERFYIEATYYSLVTRELGRGEQSNKEWIRDYPGDVSPHNNLSIVYAEIGKPEDAVREIQEAIRLVPENPGAYANLVGMASAANKLDVAQAAYDEARKRNLDSPYLREYRYMLAFLQRDEAAMQEQVQWAAGKPRTEDVMLQHQADTDSYYGRIQQARETSARAVESAKGTDAMEAAAQWKLHQALAEVELQNLSVARRLTEEALALNKGRDSRVVAALIYARAGDAAKAKSLSDQLNREFPLDTVLQNVALPNIRAATALQQHKPFQAIEVLSVSQPYELGQGAISCLYPAYLRGEAYLQSNQPQKAVAEFRKLLDNPGIVGNFVTGALVHLQLARAQARMGDRDAARKSYQDFLTLWKDADRDSPIYKQAQAEYGKLGAN